jgi:hypothetical protein
MARKTKAERLNGVHENSLIEFNAVTAAQRDERIQNRNDRRFCIIAGAQWEDGLGDQFENRPRFESNKIQLSCLRISNKYKNNRITVNYEPIDGTEDDPLADDMNDLYRAAERRSGATEAYDTAFDEGLFGGIGAWRLTTEYEDEYDDDNEQQHIFIEPINDADVSVYFSLDGKKQDKSDAKKCWVVSSMTRQAFEEEYDEDPASWPLNTNEDIFDWVKQDIVYRAEYYEVEVGRDTRYTYVELGGKEHILYKSDIDDEELDEDEISMVAELLAIGATLEDEKKIKTRQIHKYIMSGQGILEDCGIIAGKEIPIIMFYGKRYYVDNIERASGQTRLAKDMQRLNNMQISKLGEIAALGSYEKPIFTPEQIAGPVVGEMWSEDNVKDYPFMLINATTDKDGNEMPAGPLGYTKAPNIPPALAQLMAVTDKDIKELTGNQAAGEVIVSNISNEAIETVIEQLDMQSYQYISNFGKSCQRSGEVFQSMAKEIYYEEGRKLKGITSQGGKRQIEIKRKVTDKETKEVTVESDFSKANFELVVDVGPSSDTKRQALVRSLGAMLRITKNPETAAALEVMILMNMEGEGLGEAREFFRKKAVAIGIEKPTDEEQKEMDEASQNQQPSPQDLFLQESAKKEAALAEKANADTLQSGAKTENLIADTEVKYAGIERDDNDQVINTLEKLNNKASQP